MSTATAEAPVIESKPTPTPEDRAATVASLLRPPVIRDGIVVQPAKAPEPLKEVAKETPKEEKAVVAEVKKEESKKEEAKPDPKQSWEELRKGREAAEALAKQHEADLARTREEFETYKKQPVPKEYEEKLTKAEQRALELQQKLVAYDLQHEPEFQRISTGIQEAVQELAGYIVESGIPVAEVNAAIARWDEGQLYEWKEQMAPGAKLRFDEAFSTAIRLDRERTKKIQNAPQTMAEIQKARAAEQEQARKQHMDGLRGETKSILDELLEKQEIVKGDPALQTELSSLLDRAAGLNGERMSTRQILQNLAQSHVLARHFQRVDKERGELAEKLAAAEKTLAEREEFIKNLDSSTPNISPTGTAKAPVKADAAFIDSILHPVVKTG